jgi:hypothetical protein
VGVTAVSIGVEGFEGFGAGAAAAPEDVDVMVLSDEEGCSAGIDVEVDVVGGSEVDMVKKLPAARDGGSICFAFTGSVPLPFSLCRG